MTPTARAVTLYTIPVRLNNIQIQPQSATCSLLRFSTFNADAPVVVLVGHTLLLSSVGLDINDISNFVDSEEGGEGDHSLFMNPR